MALQPVEYDPETGSLWVRDPASGRALRIAGPEGEIPPPPPEDQPAALAAALAPLMPSRDELADLAEATTAAVEQLREQVAALEQRLRGLAGAVGAGQADAGAMREELEELRAEVAELALRPAGAQSSWRQVLPRDAALEQEYEELLEWPLPPGPGVLSVGVDLQLENGGTGPQMFAIDLLAVVMNVRGEVVSGLLQQLQLWVLPGRTWTQLELRGPIGGAGPEGKLQVKAQLAQALGRGSSAQVLGGLAEIRESEDSAGALS